MKTLTFVLTLLLFTSFPVLSTAADETSSFSVDKLVSTTASINYAPSEGQNFVTSIVTVKNTGDIIAEEIVVEVKYFDAQKNLVDVATQPAYGIVVPPSRDVTFRIRDVADKDKNAYASSTARVVSATPKIPRQPKTKSTSFGYDLLISWGPMLLLIGVWIFFVRKMHNKNSPQAKSVELIEQQNALITRQNEILERLAKAAEKSAG